MAGEDAGGNVANVALDGDSEVLDVVRNGVFDDAFQELRLDATVALEIELVERERGVAEGEEARDEFGETLEGPEVGGVEDERGEGLPEVLPPRREDARSNGVFGVEEC